MLKYIVSSNFGKDTAYPDWGFSYSPSVSPGECCYSTLIHVTVQWLRLSLSKWSNGVCISPSPENGNRSSYRNFVFSSLLEYRTIDKVQNPSNSERHTFPRRISFAAEILTLLWDKDQIQLHIYKFYSFGFSCMYFSLVAMSLLENNL
jgi:hypothetical protein